MNSSSIGKIPTVVSYLEMKEYSSISVPVAPAQGIDVRFIANPTVEMYRELYDRVGRDYFWTARKLMNDDELQRIISNDRNEIHVLYDGNTMAGYVEFDLRNPKDIEIAYFGLFPEFYGKGLGTYLLRWAVHHAWTNKKPNRLWLHTCTLDHPRMLPLYMKVGFSKYKEQTEFVDKMK